MLTIRLGREELFDEEANQFVKTDGVELLIEHSLVSLSKWEAKHKVPFLTDKQKTPEQILDHIRFMILTTDFDESLLDRITSDEITTIYAYVNSSESATTFPDVGNPPGRRETLTSELIYYWMVGFKIPWDAQYWHLNRLLNLIRICNLKQEKPKKRSQQEMAAMYRAENARRLAARENNANANVG